MDSSNLQAWLFRVAPQSPGGGGGGPVPALFVPLQSTPANGFVIGWQSECLMLGHKRHYDLVLEDDCRCVPKYYPSTTLVLPQYTLVLP